MFASQPPAVVQPATTHDRSDDDSDVIEVVGTRPDQVQKIDRRSYQVKETPHAAQQDTLQLLRGLPAVTISPDDEVMLLGAANVTLLIDGRPLHALDVAQYLRTLHGSDIERIEIITNPSAQYSAAGTGGVINIVLRKKQKNGVSGSASAEAWSFGWRELNGSVKLKRGPWTLEAQAQGNDGRGFLSTYRKLRSVEAVPGGAATVDSEDGGGAVTSRLGYLDLKATYDLNPKTSLSAEAWGGMWHGSRTNDAAFLGLTPDFTSFSEQLRGDNDASFFGTELAFDHKGARLGETLKASASLWGNPTSDGHSATALSNGGAFASETRTPTLLGDAQVDWEHPTGKKQILSFGAHWRVQGTEAHYLFTASGDPALGGDAEDSYHNVDRWVSVYATFQQPVGRWTFMPGLRLEQDSRRISSPGRSDISVDRTDLFPTFHVQRPLGNALDLTLSYSRRIDRPSTDQLRPYVTVSDPLAVSEGNPGLRDQATDAFEANLHYHRRKLDAGLIVYDRETKGVWSQLYSVDPNGLNLMTWINAGHKADRGAQLDVNTPLARRLKVTASLNLFDSRVPIDPALGRATEETFRFTANSTLEWDGPERGGRPGDIAQLQLSYSSPAQAYQVRTRGYLWPTLAVTRSLTRKFSITATVSGFGRIHNGHVLTTPLLQEDYDQRQLYPEFKLKLVKTFGK